MSEDGGTPVRSTAKNILDDFRRQGRVSQDCQALAEWDVWDRVTPGWVILTALKTVLRLRWESGRSPADQIPAEMSSGLTQGETTRLVSGLLGDLSAVRQAQAHGLVSLQNMVSLLSAVIDEESMSDAEVDQLLAAAEEITREVLHVGDPLLPARRGVDVGPWDVSEVDTSRRELIDLGGVMIPSVAGSEIKLERSGGTLVAVTVVNGLTAIQLQAFRSDGGGSWESARGQLRNKIRGQGGVAEEWAGDAGLELRATMPVTTPSGGWGLQTVRFVGCDGPGWLLRGIITGDGAEPKSRDVWAYEAFANTVVVPSFSASEGGTAIGLRWPESEA